jgi:ribokinase
MPKGKVCVLGSFIVDLMMRAPKLPVPGETIKGTFFKIGPGGKGSNQAVAAHRAGAETTIITKIGNDEFAPLALNSFNGEGMSTEFVFKDEKAATGAALIMVDEVSGQNKIIVTLGACNKLTKQNIDNAKELISHADIFVTQLETNIDVMEYAIDIARAQNVPVILNPAPADHISDSLLAKVDYLTPNESEAAALCGFRIENDSELKKAGEYLLIKGVKNVIFTVGKRGAFLYNKIVQKLHPPFNVKVVDTTGAGDAFNGGLATALAEKKPIEEAIIFANAVASLKITKIGTAPAMPTRIEIEELLQK